MRATNPQAVGLDWYTPTAADASKAGAGVEPIEHEPEHPDDAALIARAKTDREAFGELYVRYVTRIYNYIHYRTQNAEDAEDLTARTFQRALRHIASYEDQGVPFSAWLYRIARNLVLNWRRDEGKRQLVALDEIVQWHVGDGSPEQTVQGMEKQAALLAAVQQLPEERRELLVLKFLHHMSNAEIGAVLGRSEGAVKSLYHRTLLALRDELATEQSPEAPARRSPLQRLWAFGRQDESDTPTDPDADETPFRRRLAAARRHLTGKSRDA